ncbi:MAG: hypothetical protein MUC83_10365 [Pirellula sp.]|nr:hypothetical protein [Pirellula sp.]
MSDAGGRVRFIVVNSLLAQPGVNKLFALLVYDNRTFIGIASGKYQAKRYGRGHQNQIAE